MLPVPGVGGQEHGSDEVVIMGGAGGGVALVDAGLLLLPGDPRPAVAGHHHRLHHVDLVPGNVRGPGQGLER